MEKCGIICNLIQMLNKAIDMKKTVIALLFSFGFLSAQVYNIGDVVADFNDPYCDNGEGTLNLYDYFYEQNGGDQYVIWINLFTSW